MLKAVTNGAITISADTFGAELHSINANNIEYLWQAGTSWKRYAPVLFPFICSPKDKTYKAGGKSYTMPANHGFARDSEFEFVSQTDSSVSFSLKSSEKTLEVYPYEFELIVTYSIVNGRVVVTDTVKNTDSKTMYFYIGGHPAFNCPIADDLEFDDYKIVYGNSETIVQPLPDGSQRTVIDGANSYPLTRELFDYDVIMKDHPNSTRISLVSDKSEHCVTLDFPESKCIAVWSPTGDDNAAFVCLEPWTSVPVYCDDAFENIEDKPNAIRLSAGESFTYTYSIEVK